MLCDSRSTASMNGWYTLHNFCRSLKSINRWVITIVPLGDQIQNDCWESSLPGQQCNDS